MKCVNCGADVSENSAFCTSCGNPVASGESVASGEPALQADAPASSEQQPQYGGGAPFAEQQPAAMPPLAPPPAPPPAPAAQESAAPPPPPFTPPPPPPYSPPAPALGYASTAAKPSGGGNNLSKFLIPLGALAVVALAAIVLAVLMMTGVINIGGGSKTDASGTPAVSDDANAGAVTPEATVSETPPPAPPSVSVVSPSPTPTPAAPSETPEIETQPPEPIEPPAPVMPDSGGAVEITGPVGVEFTPDSSGIWDFYTTDSGDDDPCIYIYDSTGNMIAYDDDSGEDYNAYVSIMLEAGETYTIEVDFYYDDSGECVLIAEFIGDAPQLDFLDNYVIPGYGGLIWVSEDTDYIFIPERSGIWEFRTSYNDDCDPFLQLYEYPEAFITYDDDGAGDLNSLISVYLEAGRIFVINASDAYDGPCDYILSVLYVVSEPDADETIAVQLYGVADYSWLMSEDEISLLTATLRDYYNTTGIIIRVVISDYEEVFEGQFLETLSAFLDDNNPPPFGLCLGVNVNTGTPQIETLRYGSNDFSGIIGEEWLEDLISNVLVYFPDGIDSGETLLYLLLNIVWGL